MRLRIQFDVPRVPLLCRNAFMSYFKEVLRSSPSGERCFQKLFHYSPQQTNKAPKPFCFAVRFLHVQESQTKEQEYFRLVSPLGFYFSTLDPGLFVISTTGSSTAHFTPFKKGILPFPTPSRSFSFRKSPSPSPRKRFSSGPFLPSWWKILPASPSYPYQVSVPNASRTSSTTRPSSSRAPAGKVCKSPFILNSPHPQGGGQTCHPGKR